MKKIIDIYDKMKNSSVNSKIIFEIGILDYCDENISLNNNKIISREIISKEESCFENNYGNTKQTTVSNEECSKIEKIQIDNDEFKKIRINNTFVGAIKENLMEIKSKWIKFDNYAFDKEFGAVVCTLLDAIPVAASKDYVILSCKYDTEAKKINENYLNCEEILSKCLQLNYNIVAISENEWLTEKQNYVNNIKNKQNYHLNEDKFRKGNITSKNTNDIKKINTDKKEKITDKIFDLFDSEDIEIK